MSGLLKLITGKKGSGKSLWVVDQLFKEFDKGIFQHYYSDITNLKHTGVEPAPENWTDIEDNSLIIYDEVQFKLLFSRFNSKRDKQILELTTMRKRGIEMWIITQQTRALNADVVGLVDEHVHIERNGDKTSKVYVFQDALMQIRKTDKMFAFDKYVFAHPQHLYGFYDSVKDGTNHVKRSWLNKGVISTAITLALVVIFGGYYIYKGFSNGLTVKDVNEKPTNTAQQAKEHNPNLNPNKQKAQNTDVNQVSSAQDLSEICRQASNLSKPECVKWYDDLSKNKSSVNPDGTVVQTVSYNPNKPYDFEYQPQVQPTDFPRMSGVIRVASGQLMAVDQQGNYMLNVSQKDCQRWLSGYRPFDYFAQQKQSTDRVSTSDSLNQNTQTSSL